MAFNNSCRRDRQYPEGPAERCMRKEEEPNWQILLEVSKSAPWSEPAAVDLEILEAEIIMQAGSCIYFIKM